MDWTIRELISFNKLTSDICEHIDTQILRRLIAQYKESNNCCKYKLLQMASAQKNQVLQEQLIEESHKHNLLDL
ncbi:MAG: hypothetical protein K2X94_04915, partial [Amoebophilaceae bacterium]|nr:hypothetical protein [Amoebophilaceae bacterium]